MVLVEQLEQHWTGLTRRRRWFSFRLQYAVCVFQLFWILRSWLLLLLESVDWLAAPLCSPRLLATLRMGQTHAHRIRIYGSAIDTSRTYNDVVEEETLFGVNSVHVRMM